MKLRYLLLIPAFFAVQVTVKAQIVNNLVVFSNEGERFTVILDGVKENQTPENYVRIVGLDLKVYQVKIIFENKKLKDVNTTLTFFRTGKECIFALNKHGKKKHTLDYNSEKEIDGFIDPATQQNPQNINAPTSTENLTSVPTTAPTPEPVTNPAISTFQTALNNALTMLANGTLNVNQIKQVFAVFSTDQSRLAFAKQACAKLKDPNVYTEIVNLFANGAIRQELQLFLQSKK